MARAASALSPAVRTIRPQRVFLSAQTRIGASATPMMNSTLISQRGAHLRNVAPPAEVDRRQLRRRRLDQRLAEIEGEPGAEQHEADADGDVVDARQPADPGVQRAQHRAGDAGRKHAEPGRAGEIGDAVAAHRAHDQRAFEAEIDAAAALGDAFAEADEEERRADADGAAEHGERHAPAVRSIAGVGHVRTPFACRTADAAVERLAREDDDEDDALQHQHRGVRQAEPALQQAAARADAAEQDRDRNDGQRILPRQERHQDAA